MTYGEEESPMPHRSAEAVLCQVCGEYGQPVLCGCGAEMCEDCYSRHACRWQDQRDD